MLKHFPDRQGQEFEPNPQIGESTAAILTRGMAISDVEERLGPPAFSDDAQAVYFGDAGMLLLPLRNGKLKEDSVWTSGSHNQIDLFIQLALAIALTPVSLFALFHLGRVLTTRAELSDAGLKLRGKPLVPFDAMTAMDASRYRKKGWLEISYSLDGRDGRVRLDDYVHREFAVIVREICSRKGFESPLRESAGDDGDHENADSNTESSNSSDTGSSAGS